MSGIEDQGMRPEHVKPAPAEEDTEHESTQDGIDDEAEAEGSPHRTAPFDPAPDEDEH